MLSFVVVEVLMIGRRRVSWLTTSEELRLKVCPWLKIRDRVIRAEEERRRQAAELEERKLKRAMKS